MELTAEFLPDKGGQKTVGWHIQNAERKKNASQEFYMKQSVPQSWKQHFDLSRKTKVRIHCEKKSALQEIRMEAFQAERKWHHMVTQNHTKK